MKMLKYTFSQVQAEDESHKVQIDHPFSLDGTRLKTKFLPKFFLMPNLGMLVSEAG